MGYNNNRSTTQKNKNTEGKERKQFLNSFLQIFFLGPLKLLPGALYIFSPGKPFSLSSHNKDDKSHFTEIILFRLLYPVGSSHTFSLARRITYSGLSAKDSAASGRNKNKS